MRLRCFYLDSRDSKTRLYMAEISSVQALSFLDSDEPIEVTEFGAYGPLGGAWVGLGDLPRLETRAALCEYLAAHDALDLVDLSVRIGPTATVETHDDGEVTFTLPNDEAAFDLLRRALPAHQAETVRTALATNRGSYVTMDGNEVCIFATFDDYLRTTA